MTSPARSRLRIVIADDHQVVRVGLRSFLERHADLVVVGEASSVEELLCVALEARPDVVLTDLRMPGTDLIPAIRTLVERGGTRVLVFSAFDEPTAASSALGAGASGYVLKESSPAEIVGAIRKVSAGGRYVDPHVAASVLEELGPSATPPEPRVPLSQRETRVLQLVGMGYTGRQIAVELGVSEGTVDSFRHRIRRKLGLKSRSEVMAFARSSAGRGTRGPR